MLATFLFASYEQVKSAVLTAGTERAKVTAGQLVDMLGPGLRRLTGDLHRISADPAIAQFVATRAETPLDPVESHLRPLVSNGSQVIELWTMTGDRILQMAVPNAAAVALPSGAAPSFTGVRLVETPAHVVAFEGIDQVTPPGAPQPIGYLLVRRNVSTSSNPDALSRLMGGGARVMLGGDPKSPWTDLSHLLVRPTAEQVRDGALEWQTTAGDWRVGAVSNISGTPWQVAVDFPRAAILAPADRYLRRMLLVGLLFMLVAVVAGRLTMARVTKPLADLTNASEALAADAGASPLAPGADEIGRIGAAFTSLGERSSRLAAENQEVRTASRLKSEFLANMSHELRTPLNAVIGFSTILQQEAADLTPELRAEFVGHILTSGRHLLELINDVLDLSKVEAGKLEFVPEPIDLERVIGEVLAVVSSTAASKRISTVMTVDRAIGDVTLDAGRLKQVLYNYVSNALKFTPDGGRVTIRATPEGADRFRVEVEDNGVGIAAADMDRLFVEFQQLDAGAAKHHAGTGLGLALTKRLVEAQGGSVGATSVLGKGSVFHAVLPTHATAGAAPQLMVTPLAGAGRGPAILVIEDDPNDRKHLVEVLLAAGFVVEAAATGSDAIARCEQRAFDAVTLDLLLPDQSGLDLIPEIRRRGRNPDVPIVVVTVVAEEQALAGHVVTDILPKPVRADALLASLRRAHVTASQPGRIMVVDDDESAVRLASVALQSAGFSVEGHTDPVVGLAAADGHPPAAIVVDLLMPGLDGFQFIEELRALPSNRTTPVIVWTAKELTPAEHRRLSESARLVLQKGRGRADTLVSHLRLMLAPRVGV